ncbi:LysR family transcriptional regulator [Saccharothrix violaceirubra]|uniref:DNA-binding transcriptional LysR family regulator n=1 Tax=Saccharothrix violaceirubra TaxID=413306 RepID=A0A7W7WTQ4_9PSEU|nr:LysR family transcriptional regulator [Saccharothrix violaceirubra]MBB4962972.1 DNA-binding transcriptional LysR family regulator [Saccharothrix violaceirubra]
MLDVRRLQVLRAVVTTGSITAAATNLGYTPSAISQQVAALEKQAGLALLDRVGRGVRPTVAGRLLTEHAGRITERIVEAEAALADLRAGRTGRLRVRYFATAGAALVPPAVAAFRTGHPDVQLDLKLTEPDDPMVEVEAGRADIAVVIPVPGVAAPRGVHLEHMLDDPYVAVLPRGHALARKRVVDLADLADEPWVDAVVPPGPCRDIVLDACAGAGFSPNIVVEADDHPTAQGFVAAGLGVTIAPRLSLDVVHHGVVVRRLRHPEPMRTICVAVRDEAVGSPAVTSLIEALKTAGRSHGQERRSP